MNVNRGTIYGHALMSNAAFTLLDQQPEHDQPIWVTVTDTESFRELPETNRNVVPAVDVRPLADGRIVAEISGLGAFVLDPSHLGILAPPARPGSGAIWQHTVYSWAIPLMLIRSGRLILHAAAIETTAGALIVMGPSMRGKTSFAAEAMRSGYRLLGEDGIAIRIDESGRPIAYPGSRALRLRHGLDGLPKVKETEEVQRQFRRTEPLPVAAVVALRERTDTGTHPEILGAAKAIGALRLNSFSFADSMAALYPTFGALARSVPVAAVSLRNGLPHLADEVDRLVRWAVSTEASPLLGATDTLLKLGTQRG